MNQQAQSETIEIVGAGVVGDGMGNIFPEAIFHDPEKGLHAIRNGERIKARLSIVCVPTPMMLDGHCDTSIVEEVVKQSRSELILIKSTVTPGTTEQLRALTGKRIVFSPEYMGESKYWTPAQFPDPLNPISHGFMILGGERAACSAVADLFLPKLGPATRFRFMSATEAELVKYAENSFFALKVAFANELRRICETAGVNYHCVREGWLDDPRVGPMHTAAFRHAPGFSGKCLPKDIAALAAYCRTLGMDPVLLDSVMRTNESQQESSRS